jgi:putative phosphoribosyl transferase
MYFASRTEAGRLLATKIARQYTDRPCAVVGLGDGGVMVGAQIAQKLRAPLHMLLALPVTLPRENQAFGAITENGSFATTSAMSAGEKSDMMEEYHNFIEQEKRTKLSELHQHLSGSHLIRRDLLVGRNVILASDGLADSLVLDVVATFFKPIRTRRLLMATPFATLPVVDRMHTQLDQIYCLNVLTDFFTVDHYYERQDVPSHEMIAKTIHTILSNWHEPVSK